MRRGFTMIELLFVLITLGVLSIWGVKGLRYANQFSDMDNYAEELAGVLQYGVFDVYKGYVNGSGGDCSSGVNYLDISAIRVAKCSDINNTMEVVSTGDETDGTLSYFHGLQMYSDDGAGCKTYFDDDTATSFYMFIDCDLDEKNEAMEGIVVSAVRNRFPTAFVGFDEESTALDNDTGGTAFDGKVRILLEK